MTQPEILACVSKNILDVLPDLSPDDIAVDSVLIDLGCNSVDRMDVIIMSMEEIGIKVPLMSFSKVTTVGDLVSVLQTSSECP